MKVLLLTPLVIMLFCSLFSYMVSSGVPETWGQGQLGIEADAAHNSTVIVSGQEDVKYWDWNSTTNTSHPLVFKNGTVWGENGKLSVATGIEGAVTHSYWIWRNATIYHAGGNDTVYTTWAYYPFYGAFDNPDGLDETKTEVEGHLEEKAGLAAGTLSYGWFAGAQLGVVAVIGIFITIAALAGLHVFGTGNSEIGVAAIAKGGTLLSLFVVLSAGSYGMLTSIPVFGWIIYFVLSLMYALGVIGQVGHGSGD